MRALKESWPFVPELHLFHSQRKADKFIRRRLDKRPRFMDAGAQTWCEGGLAVVLITTAPETAWHTDAALLCHEAYHVVSMHYAYLGEESPSEEFVAYGVQVVSKALFEAHEKWKSKRIREKADARELLEAMRDDDGVRYSMDEVMNLTRKDAETLGMFTMLDELGVTLAKISDWRYGHELSDEDAKELDGLVADADSICLKMSKAVVCHIYGIKKRAKAFEGKEAE